MNPHLQFQIHVRTDFLLQDDFQRYEGAGFSISVPTRWPESTVPFLDDATLVRFVCQQDGHTLPSAEADVLLCTKPLSHVSEGGDMMQFLNDHWQIISLGISSKCCHPLDLSGGTPQKAGLLEAEIGLTSSGVRDAVDFTALEEDREVTDAESGPAEPVLRDLAKPTAFNVAALARSRSVVRSHSYNSRNVPAFVLWSEATTCQGALYYRYELVVHPEDIGSKKTEQEHVLLSIAESDDGSIYICRVRGTEDYFHRMGTNIASAIVHSFALGV